MHAPSPLSRRSSSLLTRALALQYLDLALEAHRHPVRHPRRLAEVGAVGRAGRRVGRLDVRHEDVLQEAAPHLCASSPTRRAAHDAQVLTLARSRRTSRSSLSLSRSLDSHSLAPLRLSSPHTLSCRTCGDWAGSTSTWTNINSSGAVAAKYPTCADAVRDPAAFVEAYFEINYLTGASIDSLARALERSADESALLERSLLGLSARAGEEAVLACLEGFTGTIVNCIARIIYCMGRRELSPCTASAREARALARLPRQQLSSLPLALLELSQLPGMPAARDVESTTREASSRLRAGRRAAAARGVRAGVALEKAKRAPRSCRRRKKWMVSKYIASFRECVVLKERTR